MSQDSHRKGQKKPAENTKEVETSPTSKKKYVFGKLNEYNLEDIESEILKESVYLDVFAGSDEAFKENILPLDQSQVLKKLLAINSYTFEYNQEKFPNNNFPTGQQIGFLAQNIEAQFPELVKKDSDGLRYVNYTQVIPIITQAYKELAKKVEYLESKLESLNQQNKH